MATAPLAAAGEQTLREKLRRDAHGTEQTYVARQRRAQRMAHLTGTAAARVYRVSPTRNPAEYDPEELYLHLRDEHDLRVEAAKAQPILRPVLMGATRLHPQGCASPRPTRSDGPCAKRRSVGNRRRRWACRLRWRCLIHYGTRRPGATNADIGVS